MHRDNLAHHGKLMLVKEDPVFNLCSSQKVEYFHPSFGTGLGSPEIDCSSVTFQAYF